MRVRAFALVFCLFCLLCVPVYAADLDSGGTADSVSTAETAAELGDNLTDAFNNSSQGYIAGLHQVQEEFDANLSGQGGFLEFLTVAAGVIPIEVSVIFLLIIVMMCVVTVKRHTGR